MIASAERPAPATPPIVLYVGAQLPSLSETFVYNEVLALRDGGWNIHIATLREPQLDQLPEEVAALRQEASVVYGGGWLLSALGELLRHPVRSLQTGMQALRDMFGASDLSLVGRCKVPLQWLAALSLAARVREHNIEHVHAQMANAPTTLAMYTAQQLGLGFSFTGHANDLFHHRGLLTEKLQRAAFIACISHWHRDFYQQLAGVPAVRLPIIRCGVDVPVTINAPERRDIQVLAVGRLVEKKGFDILLEALAESPGVQAVLVGDGPLNAALQQQAEQLGIRDRVDFRGSLPNDEILGLLQRARLFVLPCRYDAAGDRDGIPVALMEAMAAGCCVVSGDLPTIRELIRADEGGCLVAPGDSDALRDMIERLQRSDALRTRLAMQGHAWVANEFSRARNTQRLMNALQQAVR